MLKTQSFLAVPLTSVALCAWLLPGCGGGGSGVATPTNTPLPTNTPVPSSLPIGTATANLNVVTTATDSTTFGDPAFVSSAGQIVKTQSGTLISYSAANTRRITLSGINPATATVGATYALGSTTEMSASDGNPQSVTWGGIGKCTGSLRVQSVERKRNKVTFQLQNVILSQSSGRGSNGDSTLAVTGSLTTFLNASTPIGP